MKTRPKKLVLLAIFLMIVAISFPFQVMALYGHSILELKAVAGKLAPLNWAIMFMAPFTAWLSLRASSWLMAAIPVLTALIFYNNWLVGAMGSDYSALSAAMGSMGFVLGVALLLNRDAFQVVLNPSSRWWLTPARHRMALPVRFKLLTRGRTQRKSEDTFDEFYIKTFDVSEGGAFIPIDQLSAQLNPDTSVTETKNLKVFGTILRNLAVGTQCYVCLPLKDVNFIQCRAEIVRNTPGRGEYPAGVGIRFLGMSRSERRKLHEFLDRAA